MEIVNNKLISINSKDIINVIVKIPNSVTHIGDWAFDGSVFITQANHKIKFIDGIATIVRYKKNIEGFKIYEGSFFNTRKKCFIAFKDTFTAHGDTLRQAIEDVNFKYLQENFKSDDIVKEIKTTKKISVAQFRLLTGACKSGCENFLQENKINETELHLEKALELLQGKFGWTKIKELFI